MKNSTKIILGFVGLIVLMLALTLMFGWFGVYQTKTVGKAQQNADREVFEQTQSYVEGKRQELTKDYHEWINAKSDDKLAIEAVVRSSFANFDEEKYLSDGYPELYKFLKNVKNK